MLRRRVIYNPFQRWEHNNMDLLEILLGTWAGGGQGELSTAETFNYVEMITFRRDLSDYSIHYDQQTWLEDSAGEPPQRESGQIRLLDDHQVEMINRREGSVEVLRGKVHPVDEETLQVRLKSETDTAETRRELLVSEDSLYYAREKATISATASSPHLEGHLIKVQR
jgi:hypothetical protein